ncbi:MAG TPA: asparaginase [Candidatus Eisenbacteria bacterium]|nr:asparaginase [Candidatus Eisenbacteria bacterium]
MSRTARQPAAHRRAGVDPAESTVTPSPLVHILRRGRLESLHRGHVAVVDLSGRLVAWAGEPSLLVYPRSSFKPYQALPVVESGALARSGLGSDALALMAGSHGGTDRHADLAAEILSRAEAAVSDLACGTHPPFDKATAEALRKRGEAPSPLRHNCSGKHAGMLLLARFLGAPLLGYTDEEHPVQKRILAGFEEVVGEGLPDDHAAIDGCSAPNPRMPLATLAFAFALLGRGVDASGAPRPGLAAIRDAMREHPELVAGEGLLDTALMRTLPGIVTKIGAEAVHAIALPDQGWGVALKVEDGSDRALGPATAAVLGALGLLGPSGAQALGTFAGRVLKNQAGLEVGEIRGVARLVREPS